MSHGFLVLRAAPGSKGPVSRSWGAEFVMPESKDKEESATCMYELESENLVIFARQGVRSSGQGVGGQRSLSQLCCIPFGQPSESAL